MNILLPWSWLNLGAVEPPPSTGGKLRVLVGGTWVVGTPYVMTGVIFEEAAAYVLDSGQWKPGE